jgi:hypothetical protein
MYAIGLISCGAMIAAFVSSMVVVARFGGLDIE